MKEKQDSESAKQEEIELHKHLADEYVLRRDSDGSASFENYWNEEILASLAECEKQSVLDCCCGDGILLPPLLGVFDSVTGIDISEEMLAMARKRVQSPNCTILHADAAALPLEDCSFDAAIFRGSFHHIPDPVAALKEIRRVLRPGGRVVFVEPNGDPFMMRMLRKAYYTISPRFSSTHRSFRLRELEQIQKSAGLQPVDARHIFFFSYPFAGLLDHFPFFKALPFHAAATRMFIRLDGFLAKIPIIRGWGLALVARGERAKTE
jgi:ubiquinone/menaquinone biosynthesis C-methylase UbiE